MEKRTINNSKEDYLEVILIQTKIAGACRVTDIAKRMGVSKASASVAIKKLEDDKCVLRDDWRIVFTDMGKKIAEQVYERHRFFEEWFLKIGVSEKNAAEDACRIEHILSEETYTKIKKYIKSMEK
jgi:Mn-dependent DtxR family transcriptional regulator